MQNKIYSNEKLRNMLTKSVNSGHLCHAYLFYGQKGIGKKTIAKYFSAGILCKSDNKPCYECVSCKKVLENIHPDLYILENTESKNSIHIDEIRQIRKDAYVKPNESDYKVYIIDNAENMTIGAFNALLKVLEEPPETTIFILTCESKSAVPETILSRCIPLAVYPLTNDECLTALKELQPETVESKLIYAVEQSNGILGQALKILNDDSYDKVKLIRDEVLKGIITINEYAILKAFAKINNDKKLFVDVINELVISIRNSMLRKINAIEIQDDLSNELAFKLTLKHSNNLLELFQQTIEKLDSNVSFSLLINWLSSNIVKNIS